MADADDLDLLLDSALDDFRKLDLASAHKKGDGEEKGASSSAEKAAAEVAPSGVRGLGAGMGLPGPGKKGKARKTGPQFGGPAKGVSPASEALEKLTQQTREAVLGLGTATVGAGSGQGAGVDLDNERLMEDFVKQFEQMSGSQGMESIVETMMQQLLSKEVLQEPMKEIGERYPRWLEDHKANLAPEEYDRYSRQYDLILKLNEVYEHDSDNFTKIMELMQKMQECGQPPNDIVSELAPDLDLNNLGGQLSPEMFDPSSPNCSVM